jgi:hypothetical protein
MSALTFDDFYKMWLSVADTNYTTPFANSEGVEAYGQLFAQMVRVSQAIDTSTQAMYAQAFSGQSAPPAGLATNATVTIKATRTLKIGTPFVLMPGLVWFEEVAPDWSEDKGGQGRMVPTGRLYTPSAPAAFLPGVRELSFSCVSKGPGYGYNNPRIGTITSFRIPQYVAGRHASVVNRGNVDAMQIHTGKTESPGPAHVGHYLVFIDGSNIDKFRRIHSIEGDQIILERLYYATGAYAGGIAPIVGESMWAGNYSVRVLASSSRELMGIEQSTRVASDGVVFTGIQSAAKFTEASVPDTTVLTPESGTAGWGTVSFVDYFGLTIENTTQPTGGKLGLLEEIGRERKVYITAGETEQAYRTRVVNLPDIVSPNAVKRAANRIVVSYGKTAVLREAGAPNLPGIFFDHDYYDYGMVKVSAAEDFGYVLGERVHMLNTVTGGYATGIAMVDLLSGLLVGIGRPHGTFTSAYYTVGEWSGRSKKQTVTYNPNEYYKYRYWFDKQMSHRYFLVTFPHLVHDLYFSYDTDVSDGTRAGAYDMTKPTSLDSYDGTNPRTKIAYGSIWKAVNAARAAGVDFTLAIDDVNLDLENIPEYIPD